CPTRDADAAQNDPGEVGPAITPEQSEVLTSFVADLIKKGKLRSAIREATTKVLVTTSAAVIVGVRGGYVNIQVEVGKHCTPTFSADNPREVAELEIKYQFEKQESRGAGMMRPRLYWYRRVLTVDADTTFKEVPVVLNGSEPEWEVDPEKTVQHGFGFCPVRWNPRFGGSDDPVDGRPMIDPALYPMMDAISYTVSQRQRAV